MEPIKQEIINNIFENGDKLITGPILQTVLIDMIDDVNVKDQEILSKTGSWDEAVTQIPNLATKEEVTNLSESVARDLENVVGGDLTGYATEQWVQNQGYLKEHQDLSDYATKVYVNEAKSTLESNLNNLSSSVSNDIQNKGEEVKTWVQDQGYLKEHQDISGLATKTELTEAENNLQGNITSLSESVARDLANVSVPEGVATEAWVQSQGYLTEHQDISGLATKTELTEAKDNLQGNITSLSESVARDLENVVGGDLTGYATEAWVQSQDYASKSYVDNAVSSSSVDLTGYATETWVQNQGYLTEHQDISNLATKGELNETKDIIQDDMITLSGSMAKTIDDYTAGLITEIQNQDYASKTYVNDAVASSSVDLTGYATETWVESQGYLKEHQDISNLATKSELTSVSESVQTDISNLATKTELNDTKNTLQGNITSLSESVARDLENVNVDLTGYATETWVQSQGYLKEHQDISNLATKTELTSVSESVQTDITNLSESVANSAVWKKGTGQDSAVLILTGNNEANTSTATGVGALALGFATTASGQASHAEGARTIASGHFSHAEGYGTVASNLFEHAQGMLNDSSENQIFSVGAGDGDASNPSTVTRRNAISVLAVRNNDSYTSSFFVQNIGGYDGTNPTPGTNDLATVISGLSSGGGSSETLWKKGEGGDSIVQVTGGIPFYQPKATGNRAIATGHTTVASGEVSHAEGRSTGASGTNSHAEGNSTKASGYCSHAEGFRTTASNDYEHAQGRYNHSSTNQIFSIGTGNSDTDRRNAVSVLEVPNSDTQVVTASFFVQNVGGYDGTNPLPGTNDLATVINGMSSGGGSSETLWKKGEGTDSIVQAIADGTNLPTATGDRAIATGKNTKASGWCSHAEGEYTEASDRGSHAEGDNSRTGGMFSHAEGGYTITSNLYEHAQGKWNHTSTNQIFSVGAGDFDSRRNAVSVLAVDNNYKCTASVFVQNIGGYDGTNPTPGTNDLATVINGMAIEGGIGTSSETWTFTLEDGSTVTKNIVMR